MKAARLLPMSVEISGGNSSDLASRAALLFLKHPENGLRRAAPVARVGPHFLWHRRPSPANRVSSDPARHLLL